MTWRCPECNRTFGRQRQRHMCAPGMTLDEFFSVSDPRERPIFERVHDHVLTLGPVVVDAVQVGILFKNGPVFAEFRPKTKWVAITFMLARELTHPRLSRKVVRVGGRGSRWYHVVNVTQPGEVDEDLTSWLMEAYAVAAT